MDKPFWVYTQHDKYRAPFDDSRCAHRIYDKWRIDVVGHQCSFSPLILIDGYKVCKIHAKKLGDRK